MPYYVYILECADGTLYIGSTNDLEKRLHAHNNLKSGAHYTKIRRPVKLAYSKKFKAKGEALSREHAIKQLPRQEKIILIQKSKGIAKRSPKALRYPRRSP